MLLCKIHIYISTYICIEKHKANENMGEKKMADGFLAPTGRFYPKTENRHPVNMYRIVNIWTYLSARAVTMQATKHLNT